MNINHYITQFCNGPLTASQASDLLRSSLQEFYEKCTQKSYEVLEAESEEFEEYLEAHVEIRCDPLIQDHLEILERLHNENIDEELEDIQIEKEHEEYEHSKLSSFFHYHPSTYE